MLLAFQNQRLLLSNASEGVGKLTRRLMGTFIFELALALI